MRRIAMNQLKRSASRVFLAVTLATITGCAATPSMESTGEYVDDAVITAKVKAAVLDQPTLKSFDIHVETFKGRVRLRGVAASQLAIDKAVEVARSVNGVKSVKNEMRVM
jgi:hyperosmotically inducible protein